MKKGNVIQDKSYAFAKEVVLLYQQLVKDNKEYVLSKQFLRSRTSIAANVEEVNGDQSRKNFFHKMTIAYKETRETHYWIRLLSDTRYLNKISYKKLSGRNSKDYRKHPNINSKFYLIAL